MTLCNIELLFMNLEIINLLRLLPPGVYRYGIVKFNLISKK